MEMTGDIRQGVALAASCFGYLFKILSNPCKNKEVSYEFIVLFY